MDVYLVHATSMEVRKGAPNPPEQTVVSCQVGARN